MNKADQARFNHLLKENESAIYRICRAYLGRSEETNDLCQEVLINVWKALPGFRGQSSMSTWIYRITVNTAITYQQKKSRRESRNVLLNGIDVSCKSEGDKKEKIELEHQIDHMMQMIGRLSQDQRILIGLYLEDLSYKQIAEVLGRDTNYVGVKIKRIKQKLSKMMNP